MNEIELYTENYNYHVTKKYLNITFNLDLGNIRDHGYYHGSAAVLSFNKGRQF